ncbi:SDR family NAD(P)-dependent oxidoreductase [Chryseolinea lacunae]|uniref:SDR family NAD(P)-dependent oxidoreductase n=1 Tax=Chryseolinea lacunae TaxID=2801331 RepID=A0ABS1KYH8_9BACT|nr:SDR family NAD(P)-dependent oxidoreductase [Chryseolinea lacunae]MBL0744506.1 SDR family NAD(P)-dependent oxidoreductase [Chryseolinea lacunae]
MKKVLITGASGNLGKASVEKFLKEGYKVLATVTPGKTLGFEVSGDIQTYEADLTDEKSVSGVIATIIEQHGAIDAALLLVGGYTFGGIAETDGAVLKKMMALNFETAYYVSRPVFQQMLLQSTGGRIIFIGARTALKASDGKKSLGYALSKSLVFKLAEFLNAAGSGSNVTASVVVPSTIDTPVNREAMPNAKFDTWVKPEAIADALAHLCSDATGPWRENVVKIYGGA